MVDIGEPIPQHHKTPPIPTTVVPTTVVPTPETPPLSDAEIGFMAFLQASEKFPASIHAQAGYVEKMLRRMGRKDALTVGDALSDNKDMLVAIGAKGDAAHQASPAGPKEELSMWEIGTIVGSVFEIANDLRLLTDEQLETIPALYHEATESDNLPENERKGTDRDIYIEERVDEMLRSAGIS